MSKIHAVVNRNGTFHCQACEFVGTLKEGIKHTVANQFVVKEALKK